MFIVYLHLLFKVSLYEIITQIRTRLNVSCLSSEIILFFKIILSIQMRGEVQFSIRLWPYADSFYKGHILFFYLQQTQMKAPPKQIHWNFYFPFFCGLFSSDLGRLLLEGKLGCAICTHNERLVRARVRTVDSLFVLKPRLVLLLHGSFINQTLTRLYRSACWNLPQTLRNMGLSVPTTTHPL